MNQFIKIPIYFLLILFCSLINNKSFATTQFYENKINELAKHSNRKMIKKQQRLFKKIKKKPNKWKAFLGFLLTGFGLILIVIGILLIIGLIVSFVNIDTGSNFFPILGASVIILLDLFVGYKLFKLGQKLEEKFSKK